MFVCADVSICVTSFVPTASEKERKKERKEKRIFVRSTRLRGGGYGHREKREHQALLLFSALGRVSSPAVSHRSVE